MRLDKASQNMTGTPMLEHKRFQRVAALAGLGSVLLLGIAAVLVLGTEARGRGEQPSADAEAWTLLLDAWSMAFLLWFLSGLRLTLTGRKGEGAPAARLGFAAGAAFVVLIWVEDAALAAANLLELGSEEMRELMREFALLTAWPFGRPALVVSLAATAAAIFQTRVLPVWSAWAAIVAALANATFTAGLVFADSQLAPGSMTAEVVGVGSLYLWVLLTSLAVLRRIKV